METPTHESEAPGLEDLPTEQLEHQIELHAARANADMCSWLELIAEFDRRSGWNSWGCLTCAHWVAWRCSVSMRSAREHVRVAHAVAKLPLVHAEFALGRLSYSKVRAITRVGTEENQERLLELAVNATAAQLDRLVRAYSRASAAAAGEVHANRYLGWFWESDGSLSVHASLPAEDGALVVAAIEAAAEKLHAEKQAALAEQREAEARGSAEPRRPEEDGSAEPLTGRVSRAEALVAVASDSLAAAARAPGEGSVKPADRNMVVVHVDASELAVDGDGRCHIRDGSGLPAETARRISCDASVVTLLERDGEPLSVGRRTRSIPPAMRRAVEARDHGCRFPGCNHTRYVDAHHIEHWAKGGETRAGNLLMLCRRHHRLVHEDGYAIEAPEGAKGAGGAVVFKRPDGTVLEPSPPPPPLEPEDLDGTPPPSTLDRADSDIGPLRIGAGWPMDLDYAVLAMFSICEPGSISRPWGERGSPG